MKILATRLGLLLVLVTLSSNPTAASTNEAVALFEKYVALQRSHDPALAELYADSAVLRIEVKYPDQSVRTNVIPAAAFKPMIERGMQESKRRGEVSTYSAPSFRPVKERVRITATRASATDQTPRPMSLLVAPGAGTESWQVVEETTVSEARPFLDEKKPVQPKQEWVREVASRQGGTILFKITAGGPFSVTVLTQEAYEALKRKDTETFQKRGVALTKDSVGPELTQNLKLEAGRYFFIIRNNQPEAAEMRLQYYAVETAR
jgi:hypothetical protein